METTLLTHDELLQLDKEDLVEALETHMDELAGEYCQLDDEACDVLSKVTTHFTEDTLTPELQNYYRNKYDDLRREQEQIEEALQLLYTHFNVPRERRVC